MKQIILFFFFFFLYLLPAKSQTVDTITVMVYNLLNFPNGRNDCNSNLVVSARWDTLQKIIDYVEPDVLMVCELQNEEGADSILNRALNANGRFGYLRANYVSNRSVPFLSDLNNMLFYNSNKLELSKQGEILTDLRDVGVYNLYGKDPNLATHTDTTYIDFMVTHLKAGSGAGDEVRRAEECDSIRLYLDTASTARNVILGGDFNLYRSSEASYQSLLSGVYPLKDPISVTGDWQNDFAFANYHTQSTRSTTPQLDCGAWGGMDSRFDFLLVSDPVLLGTNRVHYIPSTYTALGNNGSTFNDAINDAGNTSAVPRSVLNALYSMSDHLPVIMDLEITYPAAFLSSDLTKFEGLGNELGNKLSWSFENSGDFEKLELEYSNDAIYFKPLAVVDKHSNTYLHASNQSHYYRLKWNDGSASHFSKTIYVKNRDTPTLVDVYPNPSTGVVSVSLNNAINKAEILVYDLMGKICWQTKHDFWVDNKASLDLKQLEKGMYVIKIKSENFSTSRRLILAW
jgi:hypothetical protein